MSDQIAAISVGVENFRFWLPKACACMPTKSISATLSFAIGGDFFQAALSDDLTHTCDYEAMCHELVARLSVFDCRDFERITVVAHQFIRDYSPRIRTGYVSLFLYCHDTFCYAQPLL